MLLEKLKSGIKRFLPGKNKPAHFAGSTNYWENRYQTGGNSGAGSTDRLALFKAETINRIIKQYPIHNAIEFGCGDGRQLSLFNIPEYTGLDVSPTAIARCTALFADDHSKKFLLMKDAGRSTADLTLSLDVIYHLVEDEVFEAYMRQLFDSAEQYVLIYSSNTDKNKGMAPHVKNRLFTHWIQHHRPQCQLLEHIPNPYPYNPQSPDQTSISEFFLYRK